MAKRKVQQQIAHAHDPQARSLLQGGLAHPLHAAHRSVKPARVDTRTSTWERARARLTQRLKTPQGVVASTPCGAAHY